MAGTSERLEPRQSECGSVKKKRTGIFALEKLLPFIRSTETASQPGRKVLQRAGNCTKLAKKLRHFTFSNFINLRAD
jgi:hypothetical protein